MATPETTAAKPPQPVPTVEKIKVKVDGKEVEVPRTTPDPITGKPLPTTMIQACSAVKVDVPHYCYHPKLPVAGNCRMCLVEFGTPAVGPDRKPILNADGTPRISKSPRPAIACATPISPGMEIYTNTAAVKQMREAVLEFLLINHPLDCPICDQAGECKLQEYSVDYGKAESRFVEPKVHKPKRVDLGPRIVLDDERCILCSRCIRFTKEIVGDDALGFISRGSYSVLTAYPGRRFDNNYTLNTVDICPVGALTSKDFRFRMRLWFLKETKSICTSCARGCNIIIGSRTTTVYRYEPRENDAVNSCWMCDYGRLNYKWINRPERLNQIVARTPAGPITDWAPALEAIGAKLKEIAPGSAAVIASSRQSNEELYLLAKIARHLGAVSETVARTGEADKLLLRGDRNPNTTGAQIMGICGAQPGARLKEIAGKVRDGRIRNVIVFGEDLTKCGFDEESLGKLDLLVASDILPNKTTRLAHFLLPGCAHAEKRGTFTNFEGRVQKFLKAMEGPGEARAEWEFLNELLSLLTGTARARTFEGLFNKMCAEVAALNGINWGTLGDHGMNATL